MRAEGGRNRRRGAGEADARGGEGAARARVTLEEEGGVSGPGGVTSPVPRELRGAAGATGLAGRLGAPNAGAGEPARGSGSRALARRRMASAPAHAPPGLSLSPRVSARAPAPRPSTSPPGGSARAEGAVLVSEDGTAGLFLGGRPHWLPWPAPPPAPPVT